jgi:hypothetical protein
VDDPERSTDDKVRNGMRGIADRMLARNETEWGTPAGATSDEERHGAYMRAALLIVGTIVVTVIVALVVNTVDR